MSTCRYYEGRKLCDTLATRKVYDEGQFIGEACGPHAAILQEKYKTVTVRMKGDKTKSLRVASADRGAT